MFWPPPNATQYATLATQVGREIKRNYPNETFVGPALAKAVGDMDFLRKIFQLGVLEYFDIITLHPYRPQIPENSNSDYIEIKR